MLGISPGNNANNRIGIAPITSNLIGTMIVDSNYTAPDGDNLSKVRVLNKSDHFVDSIVLGTLGTVVGNTVMKRLFIGGNTLNGSVDSSSPLSLTGTDRCSYILGNTTISEADGLILDDAFDYFIRRIKALEE